MIFIQEEDFDIQAELRKLGPNPAFGAVVTFSGTVREEAIGEESGQKLIGMELEHYPGMTEKQLAGIVDEARSRWPLHEALIIHRVGHLKPGENIVLVVVRSAHRSTAFEVANFLMDYLKIRATFWKKEIFEGDEAWVEMKASDQAKASYWDKK